jgi:hypothetical protein
MMLSHAVLGDNSKLNHTDVPLALGTEKHFPLIIVAKSTHTCLDVKFVPTLT